MESTILSYYRGVRQQCWWSIGLAISALIAGWAAYCLWGMVGTGILIIFGLFGGLQLVMSLPAIFFRRHTPAHKASAFQKNGEEFINDEILALAKLEAQHERRTNILTVIFLAGLLCLFLGAFGGASELILGVGAAMAATGAIQLILFLLDNYRNSFYLLRLRKYQKHPEEFGDSLPAP